MITNERETNILCNIGLNIFTADIETILINKNNKKIQTPIIIGVTNNIITKTFINFEIEKESDKIFLDFIQYLIENGINKNIIYFHNFSKFDSYLLLNFLYKKNYEVKVMNRNDAIYSIELKIGNQIFKFWDSYLMIRYGLKEGCLKFNKKYQKQEFNFELLNSDGNKITKDDILNLAEYCKNDVLSLFELLQNFNEILVKLFNIPIYEKISFPSYSYSLFLKKFYKYAFIALTENIDWVLRQGYFGGIVDLYKPYGKNLIHLDINNAYAFIMQNNKFPINQPKFKKIGKDNINEVLKNYPYCFIKCYIKCDNKNYYPILPYRNKSKIIQPTGEWIGVYWSEEIKYALETGYYTIKPFYIFYYEPKELDFIFKDYINHISSLKETYKDTNPEYLPIIKLLMNSLYGRFGVKPSQSELKITNITDDLENLPDSWFETLIAEFSLTEDKHVSIHKKNYIDDLDLKVLKSRVDWSAIITSLSRIYLHNIITKNNLTIYYSDTDSLFIPLNELEKIKHKISNKMGDLKIVDMDVEGVFIAPKTYILKYNNTDEKKLKFKTLSTDQLHLTKEQMYDLFIHKLNKLNKDKLVIENQINNFTKNMQELIIEQKIVKSFNFELSFNKREKVYDNDIWIDTKPLKIYDVKKVKK